MKNPIRTGTMIALAAGSLFAASCKKNEQSRPAPAAETKPAPAAETKPADKQPDTAKPAAPDEKTAKVHCQGINECKGKGSCKSAANACAGQNGCKGKGVVDVDTEEACKTQGGTVTANM